MSAVFCYKEEYEMERMYSQLKTAGFSPQKRKAIKDVWYPFWVVTEMSARSVDDVLFPLMKKGLISLPNETTFPSSNSVLSDSEEYYTEKELKEIEITKKLELDKKLLLIQGENKLRKQQEELKNKQDATKKEIDTIKSNRRNSSLCENCGKKLGFLEKLFKKVNHKKCIDFKRNIDQEKDKLSKSTSPGLEELKSIFLRTYQDGNVFSQAIKAAGYRFKAETSDSVIMERGDDKFILCIQDSGIRSLTYTCDKINLSFNLVVDGKMTF